MVVDMGMTHVDFNHAGAAKMGESAPSPIPTTPATIIPKPGSLPAHLLDEGEIIILLCKPSLWFVVLSCLANLFTIASITFLLILLANYDLLGLEVSDIFCLGILVAGARIFWQFLHWLNRLYVLTDRRVIRVRGIIPKIFECSLKRIQHTTLTYTLRERLFGLGTLHFSTAGTTGSESATWLMIRCPNETHQKVLQVLSRYR